jgi:hypothetical protein
VKCEESAGAGRELLVPGRAKRETGVGTLGTADANVRVPHACRARATAGDIPLYDNRTSGGRLRREAAAHVLSRLVVQRIEGSNTHMTSEISITPLSPVIPT